jgi:hypothetical protein
MPRQTPQEIKAANRLLGPESPFPDQSAIRALAYQLWQQRGAPQGSPEIDWLEAEAQLMNAQAVRQAA